MSIENQHGKEPILFIEAWPDPSAHQHLMEIAKDECGGDIQAAIKKIIREKTILSPS